MLFAYMQTRHSCTFSPQKLDKNTMIWLTQHLQDSLYLLSIFINGIQCIKKNNSAATSIFTCSSWMNKYLSWKVNGNLFGNTQNLGMELIDIVKRPVQILWAYKVHKKYRCSVLLVFRQSLISIFIII